MPLTNEELLARLVALEEKVAKSNLMMKRPGSKGYEKLVDVVCDHENTIRDLEGMAHKAPTTDHGKRLTALEEQLHVPAGNVNTYLRLDEIQE